MKKNIWIWAIAALSMAACTSEDVPTPEQIVTENDWISPDGRVVVQLSAEGLPTPTASVSRAPISGTNIKELNDLGIFALARGGDYTVTNTPTTPTVLLDNIWAKGQESETIDNTIHVDENNQALKRISLYAEKDATNASIYYYPISAKYNYDFYGYYPYSTEITKSASDVTVKFDISEGDVDLITGKATVAPAINDTKLFVDEENDAPIIGTGSVWDGYNARYIRKIKYSNELVDKHSEAATTNNITALRYVPNIKFGHRTTQLRFFVVANDKQATEDKNATELLRVTDMILKGVPTEATWSLTSDQITWSNSTNTEMAMNPLETEVWVDGQIKPLTEVPSTQDDKDAKQAGYLMVAPQDSYKLALKVHAPVPTTGSAVPQIQDTEVTIQMKDEAGQVVPFEEGKYYNVYIQLNALQEVLITAELVDWVEGDDVFVPVGEDD